MEEKLEDFLGVTEPVRKTHFVYDNIQNETEQRCLLRNEVFN